MGLFDKAKNFMTGGHAKVKIELPPIAFPSTPITVKVIAEATADFDCNGVFVDVSATESASFKPAGADNTVNHSASTYSTTVQIGPAFKMAKGETKEWTGVITLPRDVQPTFKGKSMKHLVSACGRLDTKGNDPDSGFIELHVGCMAV